MQAPWGESVHVGASTAFLNGVGPRVQESGLGLISGHAYSAPYEDVTLKAK